MTETTHELERLIDEWFAGAVQQAGRPLWDRTFAKALLPEEADADETQAVNRDYFRRDAEAGLEHLSKEFQSGNFGMGEPAARSIIASQGSVSPDDGRTLAIVSRAVSVAMGQILDARIRWADGDVGFMPQRTPVQQSAPMTAAESDTVKAKAALDGKTVRECVDEYVDRDRARPGQIGKHHKQLLSELNLMVDALGAERTSPALRGSRQARSFQD